MSGQDEIGVGKIIKVNRIKRVGRWDEWSG